MAVVADGVGGLGHGEEASKLAAETVLEVFRQAKPEATPSSLMREFYDTASNTVYLASQEKGRMATTLLTALFRGDQLTLGHVGDSRAYLIRGGKIQRLTTDHSYTSLQIKLGLLLERNAMTSQHRSTLTRAVGYEPITHYDLITETLQVDDYVLLCSDGLYGFVLDDEIMNIVLKCHPAEACKELIALAERRQASDNITVQIIQVRETAESRPHPVKDRAPSLSGGQLGVGSLLDDRFEITDLIARSGMASLFKADDRVTKTSVALKVPHLQLESDPAGFDRFKREEEIGLRLNHPFILKFIPVEKKSRPYIVMEYLEGQTLGDLLKSVRPLPEPDAVKIASRTCEALDYLHKNQVVHRDLKPHNIMLCNDGSIRIMDFGIAKALNSRRLTFVGFTPAMGTPDYMAPEQVRGSRGDEQTDIYSLGAMLYEMTTGQAPFEGDSPYVIMNARVTGDPVAPRRINTHLTPAIEEILLHALERNPKQRYQSAAEMKAELDDYEKVSMTDRHTRLRSPQVWKSRFRWVPIVIAFLLLQVVIFFLLMWHFKKK